ncbi:Toprim domain protein [Mucinivorans hirudinis]|uniref:Toprim domain protein n=1 Tax=Mucinivorans hirudinis TaxID=1433126 RepID=A0A060RAU6_9BACT|nr:Toprim domain protein [Mucinivorans hirudinis]
MLKKSSILERTNNGLDVFRHYIKGDWRVGRNFHNPLYEDTKASCNIYFDRRGNSYRMKDFGNDEYSGDCFFLVGMLNGLDCTRSDEFVQIMEIIVRDMSLNISIPVITVQPVRKPMEQKTARNYSVVEQPFTIRELDYWLRYGISTEVLNRYRVVSVKEFKSENKEGKPYAIQSSAEEPIFGYAGRRYIKIYRPMSELRFLYGGDLGDNYCFGLEQLPAKGDTIYITGGEKDVMSLAAHGFCAICFNSETSNIPKDIIHKLSYRFKHIVLLYDADKAGLESSLKHQKQFIDYGVKRLVLPLLGNKAEKDISDYFRMGNTRENFTKLFLELLETLYNDTMVMLKSCQIDFANPPEKAQEVISVNDVPLGTQGNLLCVTGGEGTGKSNYVAAMIAGALAEQGTQVDTLGVSVSENVCKKAVLLYDTEQSEVQLYKNAGSLLKRSKLYPNMPKHFNAFYLTAMSRKERLQSIEQSMDMYYHQYGGIHLVVIDGIADLIRSANDEVESIAIIDNLYRLAGIYKTCIICVLHFIPNGMKLRGHIGSELQRKAATILSIEKDDDPTVSVVKALKVRDGSPLDVPLMQFAWDKALGMHCYRGEKPREEKEKRKETELVRVAHDIFSRQKHITYIDLCDQIQALLDVKERTAKSYVRFMREKDIIIKDPSNQSYFIIGHINE